MIGKHLGKVVRKKFVANNLLIGDDRPIAVSGPDRDSIIALRESIKMTPW
jgi:hypothetical protein